MSLRILQQRLAFRRPCGQDLELQRNSAVGLNAKNVACNNSFLTKIPFFTIFIARQHTAVVYSYYGTLIGNPTTGIQWYNFRPPGVTPNRGMGPPCNYLIL